jgi:hypothetical protein
MSKSFDFLGKTTRRIDIKVQPPSRRGVFGGIDTQAKSETP